MNQFQLLTTRRFYPLFITQFLGAFNDNIYKNALVIFIAFTLAEQADRNSSILIVTAAGLFILPFFLFSALAGQLADKYEKSLLIRWIKIAEIIIMLFAALGFYFLNVPFLLLVLFCMGAHSALFGPLKYGILPQHLEVNELTGGNGMIQMGTYLAILGGTVLGGVLMAIKPEGRYLVSALVLAVAVLGWYFSRFIPATTAADPHLRINWNIPAEILNILRTTLSDRTLLWSTIAISWFWFYGATFLSLIPSYTRDVLSGDEYMTTLLLTAFSIGIGAGSLMCERLSGQRIEPGLVPVGAAGLCLFAIDLFIIGQPQVVQSGNVPISDFLQNQGWRVLADFTGLGLSGGLYIVPLYALIQRHAAHSHRGRVIAANNILNAMFMVLSAMATIILFALHVRIPVMFLLIAVTHIFIILLIGICLPVFFRRLFVLCGLCRE